HRGGKIDRAPLESQELTAPEAGIQRHQDHGAEVVEIDALSLGKRLLVSRCLPGVEALARLPQLVFALIKGVAQGLLLIRRQEAHPAVLIDLQGLETSERVLLEDGRVHLHGSREHRGQALNVAVYRPRLEAIVLPPRLQALYERLIEGLEGSVQVLLEVTPKT